MLIGASWDGTIYDIDPTTGLASNPRETGLYALSGIAFGADGTLYGRTTVAGTPPKTLYSIDVATGATTLIGDIATWGWGSDIDFDPVSDILYGIDPVGGIANAVLYTIDTMYGTASPVGQRQLWSGLPPTRLHRLDAWRHAGL